ncbi:hypothetical protein F8M41_003109 [Gigaspora margarita]|uniref:Uncharacterized protein n=1 Tax=Gigaspora margarita TaxID=4874 RepID=A0A8H3XDS8_GIGMA|nr:hypothetical protein F8M41_003109 [Gigaspora margarita]
MFYLSNKKFTVTKYRVWSDLFFHIKAGPFQQGIPQDIFLSILSDSDIINILDPLIGEPPDPLKRTKIHINEKYQCYFDHFQSKDNLKLIPIWWHRLFEWPVEQSDIIGIKNKRKIEDLEKEVLIFIKGNRYHKRIKLPFLTLHKIYSNQNNHKLLSIRILDSLDNSISLNQNEKLTISTQPIPECIAYHNMQNAEFADSFLITELFILIQDKHLTISYRKVINGYLATMLKKGLVEKEHNKYKNVEEHIFLFVTNSKKHNDETYKKNKILIIEEESKNVFEDLLVLRKLHCIEG